ncbi:MAG: lysine N(6)-hydroxylase/L-ornithine N(5)-oxygenase family protein [Methylobacterium sp.]|uniref:lysine N(6)-hydroxylase/L-ornithine N(5)-oxygenase family protein n=1 Tax=Methylobacterium sp. TaxID=409 RepID=UPI0025E9C64E|nr:lysine N(6)-hydroxylase/L-ornithine N(5)-oxygenase family protein [Methylobacterium sp.]MBX9931607.1 lysine N(6)-hydroxylase/L-ornithine N(5)-oxygenase family protein [Methylobacterium sp.]
MTEGYHSGTALGFRSPAPETEAYPTGSAGPDGTVQDVIGIGFGPSNLALAIALDEAGRRSGRPVRVRFLERQPEFLWHGGMLLPDSGMQISFLKDLVTLRDPTSPFSFVNYLHVHGRLTDYINRKSFYPSRIEFNDYLRWVASHFVDRCDYGEAVVAVEPERAGDTVRHLVVRSVDGAGRERRRRTRAVVLATGGEPRIPEAFADLHGSQRVFHSSTYLRSIAALPFAGSSPRIAVIGAGQTAAELFLDLKSRLPGASVDLIFRGQALKPADDSPFVNEIFNPDFTDFVYGQPESGRSALIEEFRGTNYSVIDGELLTRIYEILYQQKVVADVRHALHRRTCVETATEAGSQVHLDLVDEASGARSRAGYDAVILATGYRRDRLNTLMPALQPYLAETGVDRDYRLRTRPGFEPAIYLQGFSEETHGLSDTLLSILVVRGQEIAQALLGLSAEVGHARASA